MSHHKNLVEEAVQSYADAVNEGQLENILSFYSDDGRLMPDGVKTLKKNQIGNKKLPFLQEKDFKIQYGEINIKIEDDFAFVEAVAKTSYHVSGLENTSRDFFVYRKENGEWKILRYIFNNLQEAKV